MTSTVPLVSGSNGRALWYLTRSTGLVALLLLTATVVIGVVASVGWTAERWPRFLSQTVHRNLSLLCVAFVGVHIVTTVSDGYVPIGFVDAFLPLHSPYRPVWIGLGALTFDLLLAVLVTSALRRRIRYPAWRFVHWLAYLCWPIAMFHALGSGSDSSLPFVLAIEAVCGVAVLLSIVWRVATGREFRLSKRVAATIGAVVTVIALVVFAALGPLRPGWSRRSGTSAALLAQIARKNAVGASSISSAVVPANSGPAGTPPVPFSYAVTGTQAETSPDSRGNAQVVITLHLNDASSTTLVITLNGSALQSGGLILSSGTVDFGGLHGSVIGLNRGNITAQLSAPTSDVLTVALSLDGTPGQISGTVTGATESGAGSGR